MKIAAIQRVSLLDYPKNISCIIYTQGCNFNCKYCYNNLLIPTDKDAEYIFPQVFEYLRHMLGRLTGVVITGGEPTLHYNLPDFCSEVKKIGYKIKLDTNGSNPKMIIKLLENNLIDYIAMDMKAPFSKYDQIIGKKLSINESLDIVCSAAIIRHSKINYEFRSTVCKEFHSLDDIKSMAEELDVKDKYYIQPYVRTSEDLPDYTAYRPEELEMLQDKYEFNLRY